MKPAEDRSGRSDPGAWSEFDDTLADGPAPAAVPEAARPWLCQQRVLHGLLRAMHTADAAGREARIARLLERLQQEELVAATPPRRHWLAVAAAALVMAAMALWAWLPEQLPTAEAAVQRAIGQLLRDVDRRFRLEVLAVDAEGQPQAQHEFALVTRPGGQFRVEGKLAFGELKLGEWRIGSDGQELWVLPAHGMFRRAVPLAEHEGLMQGFAGVLDLGYLDVHRLVARLPQDHALRVVGRELQADGRVLLQVEGTARAVGSRLGQQLVLHCDEATGMVTRIEADAALPGGLRHRLRFYYLGEEPAGLVDYRRPW